MTISHLYEDHDAVGLAQLVSTGDVTPLELVEECISRIEKLNPQLNAVTYTCYDSARELAEQATPRRTAGPLAGVPFLIKDLSVHWSGLPVTNSCAFYKDYRAKSDWELARRAKAAGLLPVGKTNVPENGWCISTEPRLYGPTRNPWDETLVPGGSSGGSAVAVASYIVPLADASDGAGSIRVPAAINGLVGLKPSRGRTTFGPNVVDFWYGAVVFHCVSRSVRDSAAYLDAVGGAMAGDPYALAMPDQSFLSSVEIEPAGLTIGVVTELPDGSPLPPEISDAVMRAATVCESLGHRVSRTRLRYDMASTRELFTRITAVATATGFSADAKLVGREVTKADVEPVTWEVIQLGRRVTATSHAADIERMRAVGRQIVQDLASFDVVLMPVLPAATRPVGWYDMSAELDSYNDRLFADVAFTLPFNISGQPAISLPLTTTAAGLPIGTQFVGRIGAEATLLSLAATLEKAAPWRDRRPAVLIGAS